MSDNNNTRTYNDRSRREYNNEERSNRPQKQIQPPDFIAYNVSGLEPSEVSWNLDCKQIRSEIYKIINSKISGLSDVTWQFQPGMDAPAWFAWFHADSEHFYTKLEKETMLGSSIPSLSKEFTNFANNFGFYPRDDGSGDSRKVNLNKIFVSNENKSVNRIRGIRLAITPFLSHILDLKGDSYKREFNTGASKCTAAIQWLFEESNNGKPVDVVGVIITKKKAGASRDRAKPYASMNGRF